MQGAIAAGSRPTAEAGARVLEEGGNAVDACIAAAFAAAVAEGPLTGPTGGGFFLAWVDGEVTVLDCFFAAPSRPLGRDRGRHGRLRRLDAELPRRRGIGRCSRARRRTRGGAPPLRQRALVGARRACDRAGADRASRRPPRSDILHTILTGILQRDEGGRRIYGTDGRIETSDFVATLERLRDVRRAPPSSSCCPSSRTTCASYRVAAPEPVRTRILGRDVLTTPAPSRGGVIVAAALERLAAAETLDERAHGAPATATSRPRRSPSPARRTSRSSTPPATPPRSRRRSARAPASSAAARS